ncbi:hypothetical protein Syun_015061 [Stephania yunnanensis]|uniref:NAC domain-containing protein n=1 Tax=Stephania yunnanensis TaxID=152371 RepID=A0AAP0PCH3_9MAGN
MRTALGRIGRLLGQSSFWRASNGGKMMVQVHNRQFLGHKGALNYFKNKQSKTNWIMQEYTLASQNHHGPHKVTMLNSFSLINLENQ